ncbi:AAA family ATPase [Aurantimonas sp. DM33-3]|uniref:AAA family ATPase n=1 Tax=Aurantimonas sp. DM33-3 TaxID=2766955 RepID=UPI0016520155|nr:AAA family ATPase [Aurantimonas sp. DM33-3]MBC6714751.1 AAA family ATPase [Aurantimonas sp. DM33-3]
MATEGFDLRPGAIEHVAQAFLEASQGAPNKHLSTPGRELRYGRNGSLSVDLVKQTWHDHEDQTGGGVFDLLQSFGGLNKAEAVEWLQSHDYLPKRDMPQRSNGKGASAPSNIPGGFPDWMDPKPIACFEYHDDHGRLAYQVLKFPKDAQRRYMQRRRAPDGGWIWALQAGDFHKIKSGDWFKVKDDKVYPEVRRFEESERWLYHRAEVLKAIKAGTPVFLTEGEKDVETLRAWGFVATTNAGGAKYWQESFNEDLAGSNIVILNDNDDPGRTRALVRGGELRGKAKTVRLLDLSKHWPDMPEKGDVTDWAEKGGGTKDRFAELAKDAPLWRPEPPKTRFGALQWNEIDSAGPEYEYLIDGWLTEHGRSIIGGPSQSGKSFLAIHAALSVARGVDFFGCPTKRGGVIYQAGEGAAGVKKRIKAYRAHFGVELDDDVPLVFLGAKVDLFSKEGDTAPLIEEIKAQALMMSEKLRLIVIDTLATATSGADENSGKDMSVVLANIAKIEQECRAHVVLVHHMNSEGRKLRGHTSLFADVDQVITVTMDEDSRIRTAVLAKQKDDENNIKIAFELHSVKVGYHERLQKDITSCVVLPVGEKEKLKAEQERQGLSVNPTERDIMTYLFEAIERYGVFVASSDDGPPAAIGKVAVDFRRVIDIAVSKTVAEEDPKKARDAFSKRFSRAMGGMLKARLIGIDRPFIWWTGKPIRGFPRTFGRQDEYQRVPPQISSDTSPGLDEVLDEPEIPFL